MKYILTLLKIIAIIILAPTGLFWFAIGYFIKFQPENPWSLDRGMNGVRYIKYIFTENMVFW